MSTYEEYVALIKEALILGLYVSGDHTYVPQRLHIDYHPGIGPQKTILIMVWGEPNSIIVVYMEPLGS